MCCGSLPALSLTSSTVEHFGQDCTKDPGQDSNKQQGGGTAKTDAIGQVLRRPTMALLLTSHFLINLNLGLVGTFAFERAVELGLTARQAGLVLSTMGLANILGRVGFGRLLDRRRDRAVLLTTIVLVSNGLATVLSEFTPSLLGQGVFAAVYGASQGAYFSSQVVTGVMQRTVLILLCTGGGAEERGERGGDDGGPWPRAGRQGPRLAGGARPRRGPQGPHRGLQGGLPGGRGRRAGGGRPHTALG